MPKRREMCRLHVVTISRRCSAMRSTTSDQRIGTSLQPPHFGFREPSGFNTMITLYATLTIGNKSNGHNTITWGDLPLKSNVIYLLRHRSAILFNEESIQQCAVRAVLTTESRRFIATTALLLCRFEQKCVVDMFQ